MHRASLNRLALSATAHCLTGCAIGEVLGPLLRSRVALAAAVPLALPSDTLSITTMEIVDNLVLLVIPGAMEAGLDSVLFWASLALALAVAFAAAFPVNRYLLARGRGHAVVHQYHGHA